MPSPDWSPVLAPMEELGLATEILDASHDGRVGDVVGRLVGLVERKTGRLISHDARQELVGLLENAAKRTVPVVAGATSGPRRAARAVVASGLLGLETEGLSSEATDFELARQFTRFAAAAADRAVRMSGTKPPEAAAREAVRSAARRFAPGLLRSARVRDAARPSRGRWQRRSRHIVLLGAGGTEPRSEGSLR